METENLDREVRDSADVSVVVRTDCVEGGSLGEGEEETETGNEEDLKIVVVFNVCW